MENKHQELTLNNVYKFIFASAN